VAGILTAKLSGTQSGNGRSREFHGSPARVCHAYTVVDRILCFFTRIGIGLLQVLPLKWAAQLGRGGGELVFWCDGRHRRMAIANLTRCFQHEKSAAEIRALAHENFRRIGENTCCAIHTAAMTPAQLKNVLTVSGAGMGENASADLATNRVFATGHFGNFELFTRLGSYIAGYQCAATYRGIRQPALNELFFALRTRTGNLLFERRTDSEALKQAMNKGGLLLVLVADQSAGDGGVEMPFFGQNCLASRAPAVMAMRYDCELFVPICYRTGLGRWTIETGEAIATRHEGKNRSSADITRDINSAMEAAVRRDPANWFWVHNRWKPRRPSPVKIHSHPDIES
jgi:KDO2-lipid IV(A) lauroyltransferase